MLVKCVCFVALVLCCRAELHEDEKNANAPGDGPVTQTPSGKIQGSWMESRRGRRFQAYRGVRYAEAPVGRLRFQPPKLIDTYSESVDASKEGPACPLPAPANYYVDEDCLRLNVYTPGNMSKPLPVIFFIHPGGFYSMTGRSDLAGPHYLLDRDLVLVTINYRLGSLGFLSTGDELAPGNNGFKDQVAALRWVKKNIRSFGGDPNLVTIAGTSAGSISVMLHMISPMSKGLFHRGISMSGSVLQKGPPRHDMKDLAIKQAQLLHCPWHSSEAIMKCLKTKPWKELGDSLRGFFEFGFDPIGIWMPIVERDFGQERFLSIDPLDAIREGRIHAVPWIVSQTTEEFYWNAFTILRNETLRKSMNDNWNCLAPISFMLPEPSTTKTAALRKAYLGEKQLADDKESADGLGKLYGDSIIGFPVHRMANLMSKYSPQPVWYYEFAYVGNNSHYEDPDTHKPIGAMHHDDLIYLFTLSYRFPVIPTSSPHSHMVDKMTAIWYNFARHGDPSATADTPELASMRWPTMTPDDRKYLQVGSEFSIHSKLFENRYRVWDELYPIQY